MGFLSDTAGGAATGMSLGGPWGAAIGGGLGALSNMFGGGNKEQVSPAQRQVFNTVDPRTGQYADWMTQQTQGYNPAQVTGSYAQSGLQNQAYGMVPGALGQYQGALDEAGRPLAQTTQELLNPYLSGVQNDIQNRGMEAWKQMELNRKRGSVGFGGGAGTTQDTNESIRLQDQAMQNMMGQMNTAGLNAYNTAQSGALARGSQDLARANNTEQLVHGDVNLVAGLGGVQRANNVADTNLATGLQQQNIANQLSALQNKQNWAGNLGKLYGGTTTQYDTREVGPQPSQWEGALKGGLGTLAQNSNLPSWLQSSGGNNGWNMFGTQAGSSGGRGSVQGNQDYEYDL